MGKRRKSRELALQYLFQKDINPNPLDVVSLTDSSDVVDEVKEFYKENNKSKGSAGTKRIAQRLRSQRIVYT